jgi:pimeloyl-ACP methyl ester carboxylesterase
MRHRLRQTLIGALTPLSCAVMPANAQAPAGHDPDRLLAPPLKWFDEWLAKSGETPPDFSSMKAWADLPPLLQFEDGAPVRTREDWQKRRTEIRRLLCQYILGSFPEKIPSLGRADVLAETKSRRTIRRHVRLTYKTATPTADSVAITIELLVPEGKGPYPVFMTQTTHRRVGLIGLSRGYLVCIYPGADSDDQTDAFARAYPEADWGRIARRAWLASRVLDYLVTLPEADRGRVAITGHSRNGKQSMIAAAMDERFTAVVSSSSGTGGAAPFRFVGENTFEESVEFMSRQPGTADWFNPRIRLFTGREDRMPTDIHGLVALIAPRYCLLSSAYNDAVATSYAVERNYVAGREVYRLLGRPEALRIRWRDGAHEWNADDAEAYFDWFDNAFGRRAFAFPEQVIHRFDWQHWKVQQNAASLEPPQKKAGDAREAILWAMGESPPRCSDPGGSYCREADHEAALMGRDWTKPADVVRLPVNFGSYLRGDLYYKKAAKEPLPVVIWLHPYSFSSGYVGAYMLGPRVYNNLAQHGYAVFAFDQLGFGRRLMEGRDFYKRYPRWSKLGKMVTDVRDAVDFLTGAAGSPSAGPEGVKLPPLDTRRIFCLGYSLGGMVGLYATALDDRIAGVASFCGFTPMRTDTQARPTGGIRRLWEWYGLLPRLGLYDGREKDLPYDMEDVLALIAPRPCLIVSPMHDREADLGDIKACVETARAVWRAMGAPDALTHRRPDDYNRFQGEQQAMFLDWIKAVVADLEQAPRQSTR